MPTSAVSQREMVKTMAGAVPIRVMGVAVIPAVLATAVVDMVVAVMAVVPDVAVVVAGGAAVKVALPQRLAH